MKFFKNKKRRALFWAIFPFLFLFLGLLITGFFWARKTTPDFKALKTQYPHLLRSSEGRHSFNLKKSRPWNWVSYDEVSPIARDAIRISEDSSFFLHEGIDLGELKNSLKKNLREKRYARGASTITQQVVRNLYLSQEKTLRRKLREVIYALLLERKVPKKRIFEIYLNIAEWGDGIYGIRSASRVYFQKPPSQLNAKEACFLAMLLPSPKRYSVSFYERNLTDYARRTVENLLNKLNGAGYLTDEELFFEKERQLFEAWPQ